MDPRLIDLYNEELEHLRGEAREFAAEYPTAAGMLALDKGRVEDPYVERLLEGVAFLAARVRLKLDSQYPVFTQQLIDVLFPGWLAPTPSACVLRLGGDIADAKLVEGPKVPRGTCVVGSLRGLPNLKCEFETTQDVTLLPLKLVDVQYLGTRPEQKAVADNGTAEASIRLELEVLGGATFTQLNVDNLPVFVNAAEPHASQLMELIVGRSVAVGVSADAAGRRSATWLAGHTVKQLGLAASEAMLHMPVRGHAGFRVLREYAALPEKFRFFELTGLRQALAKISGTKAYLHLHVGANYKRLEAAVRSDTLALFCTPAVNLRERLLDRREVPPGQTEYNVVADGHNVKQHEVVQLLDVVGGGEGFERRFAPVFEVATTGRLATGSFYTVRRERRKLTQREAEARRAWLQGAEGLLPVGDAGSDRMSTSGAEMYIALAERGAGPQGKGLQYLSIRALCMDRETPRYLRSQPTSAFYRAEDCPAVKHVECVVVPSEPIDYAVDGYDPWAALSHLFVNYLSLVDGGTTRGADALRVMLGLYAPSRTHFLARQAEGLATVGVEHITRRLPTQPAPVAEETEQHRRRSKQDRPPAFARGIKLTLGMNDRGFDGSSPFMLGVVLEHFLAAHVSINSFVETALEVQSWTKPVVWPSRLGRRPDA